MKKKMLAVFLAALMMLALVPLGAMAKTEEGTKGTVTVYAVNNASWSNMYIYYWGVSNSPEWPGVPMSLFSGDKVYSFAVPDNVTGILFTNGASTYTKQTNDLTAPSVSGECWVINKTTTDGKYEATWHPVYYLVRNVDDWAMNDSYAFTPYELDSSNQVKFKLSNVDLPSGTQIKVRSNSTWYPDGLGNEYDVSTSSSCGKYDIYFKPDKESGWHYEWFYVAPYHTVTFNMNGHGTAPTDQLIPETNFVTEPADPTAEGYTFGGWYEEPECTTKWVFDTPITFDKTLYAKWTENFPVVTSASAVIRKRIDTDALKDMRFIFTVSFNKSKVHIDGGSDYGYVGSGYTSDYSVTSLAAQIVMGDSSAITDSTPWRNLSNIFSVSDSDANGNNATFTFTVVLTGIPYPANQNQNYTVKVRVGYTPTGSSTESYYEYSPYTSCLDGLSVSET